MQRMTNYPSTKTLQDMDADHHIHPFSNMAELKIGVPE